MENLTLFTPNYIYDSSKDFPSSVFEKENFIKNIKVLPNNTELFIISNDNKIRLLKINFDTKISTKEIFCKKESHYIYDYDILYDTNSFKEGDYIKWFFICSKENPIRVFNDQGKIIQTYLLKNQLEEIINPISIKVDNYGMNLFCGGNKHFFKVDLITDKISHKFDLKNLKETSHISCFDFNYKNDFYLCGSYSGKIYLNDYKNNKPFHIISDQHLQGVNSVKFMKNNFCFLSGGRKDENILLWDCRNLISPITNFYRNNMTNQKLNFVVDDNDRFLYVANFDGSVLVYDLLTLNVVSYFYVYDNKETVSSLDMIEEKDRKILVSATGRRHFVLQEDQEQENSNEGDIYQSSNFRFWDFKNIY